MESNRTPRVVVLAGGGVAHVSGGVGTLMLYMMEAWAKREDGPLVRVLDTRGAGGLAGAAWCFARAGLTLVWLAATGRADLVHAHMTTRGSAVRKCLLCALAGLLGRPTILHMHGADFMAFHAGLAPLWRALIGRVLRRASHVVALGEAWRPFLAETIGVAPDRIAIVLNGVPAPVAPPAATLEAPVMARGQSGPARILFLGRLGARKGVPELIEALASPALRERAWTATLAGDGEVEHFRLAVAQAGLADRVTLPGWIGREEATRLLLEADMLVLPSHHEALPMAIIEALSHRVAVVATPVGVIHEILGDGVNARLVPPGETAPLAAALCDLIDDPAQRAILAEAGHRAFLEKLDIAAVADRMLGLYRSAIEGHAPAPPRDSERTGTPAGPAVQAVLDRIEPVLVPADVRLLVARLRNPSAPTIVSFVNQHAINVAWREPHFARLLGQADVVLRDGIGVGFCLRALGRPAGLNMNGTDFIPMLLKAHARRRVAVFGTAQPWLGAATEAVAGMGCRVVASLDGFQPCQAYIDATRLHRPELVILAMGMPLQEQVAEAIAASAAGPMTIVNGGAIADFLAGRFARAPRWMREAGLEWAFRLSLEPARLWNRYGPGGVMFALRVLMLRRALRRQGDARAPLATDVARAGLPL